MYGVSFRHLENDMYCSFRGRGKRVGDSRGHHGTTLGMPRTRGWHSSTHTWAPRHVWRAPSGSNGMGPNTAYLLPAQARRCLSLMQRASWESHGRNAMD